jgi:hypothetical protein
VSHVDGYGKWEACRDCSAGGAQWLISGGETHSRPITTPHHRANRASAARYRDRPVFAPTDTG